MGREDQCGGWAQSCEARVWAGCRGESPSTYPGGSGKICLKWTSSSNQIKTSELTLKRSKNTKAICGWERGITSDIPGNVLAD